MSDIAPPDTRGVGAAVRIVSPEVRRLAAERGIPEGSLATLRGNGRGGRLLASDVERLFPPTGAAEIGHGLMSGDDSPVPRALGRIPGPRIESNWSVTATIDPLRLERARRALESASSSAPVTSAVEVDLTRPVRRLASESEDVRSEELRVLLLPVLIRHLAATLERYPVMHASLDLERDAIVHRRTVDLRLTIATVRSEATVLLPDLATLPDEGLRARIAAARRLAAAAHHVEDRSPAGLWLIERTSCCAIFETPPLATGVSATLTLGLIEKRPLAGVASSLRIGWAAYLCCTYDHRLIDGADAARFLSDLTGAVAEDD